jgi:hypothetical protein
MESRNPETPYCLVIAEPGGSLPPSVQLANDNRASPRKRVPLGIVDVQRRNCASALMGGALSGVTIERRGPAVPHAPMS